MKRTEPTPNVPIVNIEIPPTTLKPIVGKSTIIAAMLAFIAVIAAICFTSSQVSATHLVDCFKHLIGH